MKKYFLLFTATFVAFEACLIAGSSLSYGMNIESEDAMTFPKPSGQYSVGYKDFEFTDESREDPYNLGNKRRLKVTVLYPSQDALKLEAYGEEESISMQRELAEELKLSALEEAMGQFNCLNVYKSANALPVQEKFPVLLFGHGYGMTAGAYQNLYQELISHGYIVVATHHPYAADTVLFQDGEEAFQDPEKIKRDDLAVKTCEDDISFVLSSLPKMAPLFQLMDLDKIGMFGHSLGGLTTMKTARVGTRVKAALELDAPMNTGLAKMAEFGKLEITPLINAGFDIPFLHLFADDAFKNGVVDDSDEENIVVIQSKEEFWKDFNELSMKENNFKAIITDTDHNSFADHVLLKDMLPFVKEKGWTFGAGKNDGFKINRIITPLIRSFFDRFLKNQTEINLMAFNNEDIRIETAK